MEAVPRLPMVWFQLKVSPEATSFGPRLKQYIRDFYHEDAESYSAEIHQLESLRTMAVRPPGDISGCSMLKKYYCQLHFLQSRFPMGKDGAAAVTFTWRDTYANVVCSLANIRFEIISILYNIGAIHTYLGSKTERTSAEGMKMACAHFQCAAWAFEYLKNSYPQPPGVDLAPELMTFMHQLALAQAQECILEKSMLDNRKPTIVAKVAKQIVDYFALAQSTLEQGGNEDGTVCDTVGNKIYKTWKRYVKFKRSYHTAVTLLYQGLAAEEQQKMGERVAFYNEALSSLNEARSIYANAKGTIGLTGEKEEREIIEEALTFTNDVIEGKRKAAKNENEFIYHEEVPEKDSLPTVKGASLVKGISFSVTDPEVSGPDIFARLVPMKVHEASSLYSEEKAKILRSMGAKIEEKDSQLNTYLMSLKLENLSFWDPETRSAEAEVLPVPEELVERCAALNAKPTAIQELIDSMAKLSETYKGVEAMLREIESILAEEESREKKYQEAMGKRPPSIVATDLTREAKKYQEAHNKASESNQALHRAMNLHVNNLRILARPLNDLIAQIPSFSQSKSGNEDANEAARNHTKELKRVLGKVDEMRKQRLDLHNKLRDSIAQDDLTRLLVTATSESSSASLDRLFAEQLDKHQALVNLLNQNLAAQDNILTALTDSYAKTAEIRKSVDETFRHRDSMISSLISSYDAYEDLLLKSTKGLEFYRKLEHNVSKLLQRLKSTCKVQEEEREQILARNDPKDTPNDLQGSKTSSSEVVPTSSGLKLKDYLANRARNSPTPTPTPPPAPIGAQQVDGTGYYYPAYAPGAELYPYGMANGAQYHPQGVGSSYPAEYSNYYKPETNSSAQGYGSETSHESLTYKTSNQIYPSAMTQTYQMPQVSAQVYPLRDQVKTNDESSGLGGCFYTGETPVSGYQMGVYPQNTPEMSYTTSMQQQQQQIQGQLQMGQVQSGQTQVGQMQQGQLQVGQAQVSSVQPVQSQMVSLQHHHQQQQQQQLPQQPQLQSQQPQQPQLQPQQPQQPQLQPQQPQQPQLQSQQSQQPQLQFQQSQLQPQSQQQHQQLQYNPGYQQIYQQPSSTLTPEPGGYDGTVYYSTQGYQGVESSYTMAHPQYPTSTLGMVPSGMTSSGMTSSGMTSSGMVPSGMTSSGMVPSGMISSGMAPSGMTSSGMTSTGMTSTGTDPSGMNSSGMAPAGTYGGYMGGAVPEPEMIMQLHANAQGPGTTYQSYYPGTVTVTGTAAGTGTIVSQQVYPNYSGSQPDSYKGHPGYTYDPQTGVYQYSSGYQDTRNMQRSAGNEQQVELPQGESQDFRYTSANLSSSANQTTSSTVYSNNHEEVPQGNGLYYSTPYGVQTPTQGSSAGGVTVANYSQTYMQASNNETTTSSSKSNVDLLADLEITINHAPLVPKVQSNETKPAEPEKPKDEEKLEPQLEPELEDRTKLQQQPSLTDDKNESFQIVWDTWSTDVQPKKDPLGDPSVLGRFACEIEKLEKFVDGLLVKTLSGATNLEIKWKEVCDFQEREEKKHSLTAATSDPECNRNPECVSFDSTRVEIRGSMESTDAAYVNASLVRDITQWIPVGAFIVTQLPLPHTLEAFWTMVWEQESEVLVCLIPEAQIAEDTYWPENEDRDLEVGSFRVVLKKKTTYPSHVQRVLAIVHRDHKTERDLVHMQFLAWPSSGFPASPGPLLAFARDAMSEQALRRCFSKPIVVHCLDGGILSGLFLLAVAAICNVRAATGVDVPVVFSSLVKCRKGMVSRDSLLFGYRMALYHAQDSLMKRGILSSSRSTFECFDPKLKGPKKSLHHPSDDFLNLGVGIQRGQSSTNPKAMASDNSSIPTISISQKKSEQTKPVDPLSQLDPLWSIRR